MSFNYSLLDRYIIHYVGDPSYGGYIDAHTHGLVENFSHKDLQIVFPYETPQTATLLNRLIDAIDKGTKFEVGIKYPGFFTSCDIEFIEVQDRGRVLLRLLIPDGDCISPLNPLCEKFYRGQVSFDPEEAHNGSIT